jgi:hypothetical protein
MPYLRGFLGQQAGNKQRYYDILDALSLFHRQLWKPLQVDPMVYGRYCRVIWPLSLLYP